MSALLKHQCSSCTTCNSRCPACSGDCDFTHIISFRDFYFSCYPNPPKSGCSGCPLSYNLNSDVWVCGDCTPATPANYLCEWSCFGDCKQLPLASNSFPYILQTRLKCTDEIWYLYVSFRGLHCHLFPNAGFGYDDNNYNTQTFFIYQHSGSSQTCPPTGEYNLLFGGYSGIYGIVTSGSVTVTRAGNEGCSSISGSSGACCVENGCGMFPNSQSCLDVGGTWQGAGTNCNSNPCGGQTGACCFGSNCYITNQLQCEGFGGIWHGVGSNCSQVTCTEQVGPCCMPSGNCIDGTTQAECFNLGGSWQGGGISCATMTSACPVLLGACCDPFGSCENGVTQEECNQIHNGAWYPELCDFNTCFDNEFFSCCHGTECTTVDDCQACQDSGGTCQPGICSPHGPNPCEIDSLLLARVVTDDDFDRLDIGQRFVDPEGNIRIKI